MKRLAIFFLVIIAIVTTTSYAYMNYKTMQNTAKKENHEFEMYKDEEITGTELVTIMNKVVDTNEKNEVQKDDKENYINNDNNSINIDIQFIDDDVIYNVETIYNRGIENFLNYYRNIFFKCSEIRIS